MKEMKFRVHSKEHGKAIQKRLFELGYGWEDGGNTLRNYDSRFFYAENTGKMYRGTSQSTFPA